MPWSGVSGCHGGIVGGVMPLHAGKDARVQGTPTPRGRWIISDLFHALRQGPG